MKNSIKLSEFENENKSEYVYENHFEIDIEIYKTT